MRTRRCGPAGRRAFLGPAGAAVLALLLASGCGGGGSSPLEATRDASAPMQSELLRYLLDGSRPARTDVNIVFTYRNPTADTLYFTGCWRGLLPALQRKQEGGWVDAFVVIPPPCLNVLAVPPHLARTDTLAVCYPTAPTTSSCAPWRTKEVTGLYRLRLAGVYFHYDSAGGGRPAPDSLRISNEFVLELK